MTPNQVVHISHRSRFAVAAMVDIAAQPAQAPVRLGELAARHQVSLTFAEKVFSDLRECGLVNSMRGPHGGYRLARSADTISVAEVVRAVPGTAAQAPLPAGPSADGAWNYDVERVFGALRKAAFEYLEKVTIESLVADSQATAATTPRRSQNSRRESCGIFPKPGQQTTVGRVPNSVFALGESKRQTGRGAAG